MMCLLFLVLPLLCASFECPSGSSGKVRLTGTALARGAAASSDECCARCSGEARCAGWVFYLETSSCVLKNETRSQVADDGCVSGTAAPAPVPPVPAGLSFATLFQGGAVLQRGEPVAVWGRGAAGPVRLSLDGEVVADGEADDDGSWSARLPERAAAFNVTLAVSDGVSSASLTLSIGDVLLCAGQSNMGMPVLNTHKTFQADNGTAEVAAADRFTGSIWLWKQPESRFKVPTAWAPASAASLSQSFSAVCWYTGRSHYERLGGSVPVGLLLAAVGGSPIEFWLSNESIARCEVDEPRCDDKLPDAVFHDDQIVRLQPYTIGAIIWDQAERDLKCNHVSQYPCLQRELVRSWREEFQSPNAAFVAVQLPDYFDPKDPGGPNYDPGFGLVNFSSTGEGVLAMRLAQEAGLEGVEKAGLVASYDQSCNDLAYPDDCPNGSVHNVHKQLIGSRVAAQLARLRGEDLVAEGPRARGASASAGAGSLDTFAVTVTFDGDALPFSLAPTRNCTACCTNSAQGDFDASVDGRLWTSAVDVAMLGADAVGFQVKSSQAPRFVRYTGGSNFTQCALFNTEGFPALPFQIEVEQSDTSLSV